MKSRASQHEHCRRLAAQIFAQLPEDHAEALLTLRYARDILRCLGRVWPEQEGRAPIRLVPAVTGPVAAQAAVPANRNDRQDIASPASRQFEPES